MAHEKRLAIAEVLIHHIDVLRWLLGPLKLLSARTAHKLAEVEGETLASLFLETAAGAPVTLIGDMAAPGFSAAHGRSSRIGGQQGERRLR